MLNRVLQHHPLVRTTLLATACSTLLLSACDSSETITEPAVSPTYRLTTGFQGDERALSVVDNVDEVTTDNAQVATQIRLTATTDVDEQRWKFTKFDDGRFTISNQSIGDSYSVDVVNDGVFDKIKMAPTGDFSGQYWTITPKDNGFCQLTNSFTGSEIALDIRAEDGQDEPKLAAVGDFSGQSWRFTLNNNGVSIDEEITACLP